MKRTALTILIFAVCLTTSAAQTTGPATANGVCSMSNSGSNNSNFAVHCGIGTAQGKKMLEILNKILANELDSATVMQKLDELIAAKAQAAQTQNNSGGINIQQGTTGANSPIINSPITVGNLPKSISPQNMPALVTYLKSAVGKAKIQISTDQYSGAVPFPDDFYDALKAAGWEMIGAGVSHMEVFSAPGRQLQAAVVIVNGDPIPQGQGITIGPNEPLSYIGNALQAFKIPHTLTRTHDQPEGTISITFYGGFPE